MSYHANFYITGQAQKLIRRYPHLGCKTLRDILLIAIHGHFLARLGTLTRPAVLTYLGVTEPLTKTRFTVNAL